MMKIYFKCFFSIEDFFPFLVIMIKIYFSSKNVSSFHHLLMGVFMNLFESTFCQILNYAVFVIRGYSCLEFIVVFSTLALFHTI